MNALLGYAMAPGLLAHGDAQRLASRPARARARSPGDRRARRRPAAAAAARAASADPDRPGPRQSNRPRRPANPIRVISLAARPVAEPAAVPSATSGEPASTWLAMLPSSTRSQKRTRRCSSGNAPRTRSRRRPANRASSPSRSGSKASSWPRRRRARVGEWPPVLTAMITGERSTIAGRMALEISASSTTLTNSARSPAAMATAD